MSVATREHRMAAIRQAAEVVRSGVFPFGARRVNRLPRLHHVTIEILPDQLPATLEFYRDIIGLKVVMSPVQGAAWFEQGIHLVWKQFPNNATSIPAKPQERKEGRHFALVLGNRFGDVVSKCEKLGFFHCTGTRYWGSPRVFVFDPANNLIELMEFSP